mmetsp:Transcript_47919/g.74838  ORF Transcript_47919/g.74838 Transcript_47919/m.74838 type:complete len:114 (+) Transcript_47919:1813-2154(+)
MIARLGWSWIMATQAKGHDNCEGHVEISGLPETAQLAEDQFQGLKPHSNTTDEGDVVPKDPADVLLSMQPIESMETMSQAVDACEDERPDTPPLEIEPVRSGVGLDHVDDLWA